MPLISEKILEQMQKIGQPRKITQTTTQPSEPFDIGQLGILLALLFLMKGQQGGTSLGITPTPPATPLPAGIPSQAPSSLTGPTYLDPLQILQSLFSF